MVISPFHNWDHLRTKSLSELSLNHFVRITFRCVTVNNDNTDYNNNNCVDNIHDDTTNKGLIRATDEHQLSDGRIVTMRRVELQLLCFGRDGLKTDTQYTG